MIRKTAVLFLWKQIIDYVLRSLFTGKNPLSHIYKVCAVCSNDNFLLDVAKMAREYSSL